MTEERKFDAVAHNLVAAMTPFITDTVRSAIDRGYELGRADYANEIAEQFSEIGEQINAVMATITASGTMTAKGEVTTPLQSEPDRASLGSVKPKMLDMMARPSGATQQEMESAGLKHNSVRGTLWSLHKSGQIEKRGSRWFLVGKTDEAPSSETEGVS